MVGVESSSILKQFRLVFSMLSATITGDRLRRSLSKDVKMLGFLTLYGVAWVSVVCHYLSYDGGIFQLVIEYFDGGNRCH